jgi:hypothetical protein
VTRLRSKSYQQAVPNLEQSSPGNIAVAGDGGIHSLSNAIALADSYSGLNFQMFPASSDHDQLRICALDPFYRIFVASTDDPG